MANTSLETSTDNTDVCKNEYYDILTTEDCFVTKENKELEIGENIILGYN